MRSLRSSQTEHDITARRPDLDKVGATASMLCALHCALVPLVITLLPLIGLSFLADERVEWALVAASACLGISSLCLGHREHRRKRALAILSVGLSLLALGRMAEERGIERYGLPLVVLGGLTIAVAHWVNRKLCLACRACQRAAEDTITGRRQAIRNQKPE